MDLGRDHRRSHQRSVLFDRGARNQQQRRELGPAKRHRDPVPEQLRRLRPAPCVRFEYDRRDSRLRRHRARSPDAGVCDRRPRQAQPLRDRDFRATRSRVGDAAFRRRLEVRDPQGPVRHQGRLALFSRLGADQHPQSRDPEVQRPGLRLRRRRGTRRLDRALGQRRLRRTGTPAFSRVRNSELTHPRRERLEPIRTDKERRLPRRRCRQGTERDLAFHERRPDGRRHGSALALRLVPRPGRQTLRHLRAPLSPER
jgi:hypothetical protein